MTDSKVSPTSDCLDYLLRKLDAMVSDRALRTQRVLLCGWLVELKLDRLNKLGAAANVDQGKRQPRADTALLLQNAAQDFKAFLEKYKESVDADTILQLMQNHGRLNDCLWFALQQVRIGCQHTGKLRGDGSALYKQQGDKEGPECDYRYERC